MNEVFDIKRLWKLMQYEVVNYIPNFFKSLLVFASVIAAVWIFSLTVDLPVLPNGRAELVTMLFTVSIVLSPFIVYKDMNNRKKGYIYAMIPASTLEKLLSMTLISVLVVPVLSYVMLTGTDLILWMLSNMGIGSFHEMDFYNPFADTLAMVTYDEDLLACSLPILDGLLYFFGLISYTMMFNTIFRKNKVMKTILFNMSMIFAFIILTAMLVNMTSPEFWEDLFRPLAEFLENKSVAEQCSWLINVGRCLNVLFSALFLTITYFRIKRVNY